MATGWAELWKRIRRLAEEEQPDFEGTWIKFKKTASRSERAAILKPLVRIGEALPARERYRLAVSIARILAPVEWPPEWTPSRLKLVSALDAFIEETDPEAQPRLFAPYRPVELFAPDGPEENDLLRVAHLLFVSARDLLCRPCRRDELRTAASLCNGGVSLFLRMLRRAFGRAKTGDSKPGSNAQLLEAANRFSATFMVYAEAAGELNNAFGAVLFEGLHASLGQES